MKIIWPTQFNLQQKVACYLNDTFGDGPSKIVNVATSVAVLDTGFHQFPLTINQGNEATYSGEQNSYVVSPLAAYTDYALVEIKRLDSLWPKWPLMLFIKAIRAALHQAALDRVVHVNNWMLSTNIYPADWSGVNLATITNFLIEEFPSHAIAFRSLNEKLNAPLIAALEAQGYMRVPSRQVYLFDFFSHQSQYFPVHHNCKLDEKLLQKSRYKIINGKNLSEFSFKRMEELYSMLYLEKYCRLNPQYTVEWLKAGCNNGWLELRALENDLGIIDGVVGWFTEGDQITAPIVGYDIRLPPAIGLYRMLTHLCIARAREQKKILNFSSGAAHFKRLRGGQAAIEHTLVYVGHLPFYQVCVWRLLSATLHLIAVPIMKKRKL